MLTVLFIILCTTNSWSQESSQRLKNEQRELKKQIENTKVLLQKSRKNTQLSLQELKLIEKQVEYREELLQNIDNQIRSSQLKIQQKRSKIQELNAEIEHLKKQYKKLLLFAYKKRNKFGDLMYIFSAETVEEAIKRKVYLEKFADIQKKQLRLIQQNQELLKKEIKELEKEKKKQEKLAGEKQKERAAFIESKKKKKKIYQKYKEQKEKLLEELQQQKENSQRLENEIAKAIKREIAEENARIEAARRKAAKAKKETKDTPKKDFPLLAKAKLVGKNFASNKGRLPWPVKSGTVTSSYGRHLHPTLKNVHTQNNGIDISTTLNANVLAVYKGVVTSVLNIPGAGRVVIIKHGNFRTVYTNLQDVYVTKGSEVDTRTPIGSLLPNKTGDISVAHFEIHEIEGNSLETLNPSLWITKGK